MDVNETPIELSIILPALNEARSLETLLPELKQAFPEAEIIVVDDGSQDDTASICEQAGCRRVANPYRMGNGAAIKRGARAARGVESGDDRRRRPAHCKTPLTAVETISI